MNWDAIDWTALGRLRTAYLSGSAGGRDYWHSESDLASYDATFAQRIGWKWDYVLRELTRRGWELPIGELLDWGCGSGIAGRALLDHFGTEPVTALQVWDRSAAAMAFAARRARGKYPGLEVNTGLGKADGAPGMTRPAFTLLISHVLPELTTEQTEALMALAVRAQCVLWVEPGNHAVSRLLIAIRERLRESFNVIAPCTHAAPCGMQSPGNDRHWCHHFAASPREIFTDSNWSRFARLTGIDLRDLPLSFLVLDQRPAPPLPSGAGRMIGRPRIYKAYALLLGCDATGVRERKLSQRTLPIEFRALKKSAVEVLGDWDWAGAEILAAKPLPGGYQ
jgi:Mitochondrial small ribosomal subunit Rsm22